MNKNIKCRYDKKLDKYHIEYHLLTTEDQRSLRLEVLNKLNDAYDLAVLIDTQMGSVTQPDQRSYAQMIEGLFTKHNIQYHLRPVEMPNPKQLFGFFTTGNKTVTQYVITFIIEKGAFSETLFDDLLCEFDTQIGYGLLKSPKEIFIDMEKGYLDNVFDQQYFSDSLLDSRIFKKFLSSKNLFEQ